MGRRSLPWIDGRDVDLREEAFMRETLFGIDSDACFIVIEGLHRRGRCGADGSKTFPVRLAGLNSTGNSDWAFYKERRETKRSWHDTRRLKDVAKLSGVAGVDARD